MTTPTRADVEGLRDEAKRLTKYWLTGRRALELDVIIDRLADLARAVQQVVIDQTMRATRAEAGLIALRAELEGLRGQEPVAWREFLSKFGGGWRYYDRDDGLPAGGLDSHHAPLYASPVSVTAAMIEAVRLHLEIRAGEDAPIDIPEMLRAALSIPAAAPGQEGLWQPLPAAPGILPADGGEG